MKTNVWPFSLLVFIFALAAGGPVLAANSGVTYQGRILKPDGTPLSGVNTQFKMQIRTPDGNNCLMYEELQSLDMSHSNGSFSITMNDGTGTRTDATALNLDRIFSNFTPYTFDPATCTAGSSYSPSTSDGRNLVVLFKDETMATWEPVPAQKINYVPFAFEAKQVQGFNAASLLRVQDAAVVGNVSPLSTANYNELVALINGTTAQYSKAGQLSGVAMPAMNSGEVLGWNGTAWVSTSPVPGANTVTNAMLQSSSVGTAQIANNVSIATSGTLTSAISTTRDFKIFAASPSLFSIDMQAPALTASYSLVWPLDDGNPGQVLTTDGSGNLTWGAGGTVSQWTTNGLDIGYTTGKVGIGTTAPGALFVASANTSPLQAPPTTTVAEFSNADATNTRVVFDAYGAGVYPSLTFRNARGTAAAPSALQSGDILGQISFLGYGATGYPAGSSILVKSVATENWTDTAQGRQLRFYTTGNGTTGSADRMRIDENGNVGIGIPTPTAGLHIRAGSAAAGSAPLKLSSGPVMTTAEDGAMEYDSTNLYYTIGSTRYVIPTNTAAGNYSNVSTIGNAGGSITMSPFGSNSVIVNSTATSTSPITGGLVVTGGAGITGSVNVSSNIVSGGAVTATTSVYTPQIYGASTASANIKIDGADNAAKGNVLLASAGGKVGIGTTAPAAALDVSGEIKAGNTGLACSATTKGSMRYNNGTNAMEFCNGTSWTLLQVAACTNGTPGAFAFTPQANATVSTQYSSDIAQITGINCTVNTQISGNGSPQYRICSDAGCGTVLQSWTSGASSISVNQYIQVRATSSGVGGETYPITMFVGGGASVWNLTATGDCTSASPAVGTLCADGSVYAGITPDGSVKMYAQRCDMGRTWNGTACVGGRLGYYYDNGSGASGGAGASGNSTGSANTAALAALADAGAPYQAANACANLVEDGHSDWYLPASNEMQLIGNNNAAIGDFNYNWTPYWSSTGIAGGQGIYYYVVPNTMNLDYKNVIGFVRCVRH